MNLNQLKLFYQAVKSGSLSAAAQELHITQPAVTKGIQRLQEHYEVKLVHRMGKKLTLTRAGASLYAVSEKIFEMEQKAEDCLREYRKEETSRLRIDASESFGAYYLPEVINRFNHLFPNVRVTVDVLPNRRVVENTAGLNNDLGFISQSIAHPKLFSVAIAKEELVFIVPPAHPLAEKEKMVPADLSDQTIIMHEDGSALHEKINRLMAANRIVYTTPLTLSNNEAIKRAVAGGSGITLISRKVASEEIRTGRLKAVGMEGSAISRKFYMIHHKEKHLFTNLQSFMDLMIRCVDSQ